MKPRLYPLLLLSALFLTHIKAEDTVLKTAPVPNRLLKQGEARLITRGDAIGVRIHLHTRHLETVRDRILATETANWPEHPASVRYREALSATTAAMLESGNGKLRFQIEWFLRKDGSGYVRIGNETHHRELADLPINYLKRNLLLIMADRFDLTEKEAQALLTSNLRVSGTLSRNAGLTS